MKVLICEHEELLLTTLVYRIRKHGFAVETARNRKEALKLLRENSFDLLVADIFSPEFLGIALMRSIRRNSKNKKIPILLIADLEQDELMLHALKLGARDFVTKPFKPDELVIRIKGILQSKMVNAK
jgi:DNA-binding response OmpR family regulator